MKVHNLSDWRDKVLKRDNYMCQDCGTHKNLIAHHIKSQYIYPQYKFQVENGMTLCRHCHRKRLEFALRLFHYRGRGYLPKLPSAEEVRVHNKLVAELNSLPVEIRYSYHSCPHKIKVNKAGYWVSLPKIWVDRALRMYNVSAEEFVDTFYAKWSYKYGLPYMKPHRLKPTTTKALTSISPLTTLIRIE